MGVELSVSDWAQLIFVAAVVGGAIIRSEAGRASIAARVDRIEREMREIEEEARQAAILASNHSVLLASISQRQDRDFEQISSRLAELLAILAKLNGKR